jgi:protein-ribulosamine 3-kinase
VAFNTIFIARPGLARVLGAWGVCLGGGFEKEYGEVKGKDEPVGEWEDRVELYEL